MCACGTTYARSSLAVWRQLTTHTRARREPAQLHRGAHHLAHSSLCTCTVLWSCCQPKLVLRARPPLAGGVQWSPTRDHGPCEARAKQLRLSFGDQEEQRAHLADRLLLRILRSRYAASCFACRGWLRSAKGTYRGNTAAPSSWPSWASTFLPASSQLPGKRILRCVTVGSRPNPKLGVELHDVYLGQLGLEPLRSLMGSREDVRGLPSAAASWLSVRQNWLAIFFGTRFFGLGPPASSGPPPCTPFTLTPLTRGLRG